MSLLICLLSASTGVLCADVDSSSPNWSFDFHDLEVRQALRLLAKLRDIDLVIDSDVSGRLTMSVREANWQAALDALLDSAQLEARLKGRILHVSRANPERSVTVFVPIEYASAQNISSLLSGGLLPNLSIKVDKRSNTLLLRGNKRLVKEAKSLASHLDTPLRQMRIEASIAVVRKDWAQRLGLSFSGSKTSGGGRVDLVSNLGLENSLGLFTVQREGSSYSLRAGLAALESRGFGEVISNPQIITGNRQTATIKSGAQIPYQESAANGRTTVQFKDAVLKLTVTPTITPNNRILLDLVINQDAPGALVEQADGSGNQIPAINVTELRTRILLEDGETVGLGGVFKKEKSTTHAKIPVLSDIPLLGRAFRRKAVSFVKTETLIFITPSILPR